MNTQNIRTVLIKMLLGTLVIAAFIAVVAILVGTVNDVVSRSIGTVFSAMLHIFLLFGIISVTTGRGKAALSRSTDLVINTSMLITVLSFFTSVFGIWGVLDGEIAAKLYVTYIVLLFVLLHTKTLMDVEAIYTKVRPYVLANYVFMALVAALILGVVYVTDNIDLLSGFYGRLLAASAIIDVTLSIIVAVMHRLYIQKHPDIQTKTGNANHASGGKIILIIVVFLFIIFPLMRLLLSFSTGYGY